MFCEHMTQKCFLFFQKYPLKTQQFNRPPGHPLYSMSNMRPPNANAIKSQAMMGQNNMSSAMDNVAEWVQQQNQNLQTQNFSPNNGPQPGQMGPVPANNMNFSPNQNMPPNMGGPPGNYPPGNNPGMGPQWNPSSQSGPMPGMNSPPDLASFMGPGPGGGPGGMGFDPMQDLPNMPNMPNMRTNLSHDKVPNENLTPEQLQRREEQLANLRKLQSMLFGQGQGQPGQGPPGMGPGQMNPNMMPPSYPGAS